MSNEHSYERLCDYYKAKQKEKDMIHSKPKHEVGARKEVTRFAFFPMIIESRLVWLRRYKAVREYQVMQQTPDDWYCHPEPEYFWITVERKIIRR